MLHETSKVCIDSIVGKDAFSWHIFIWEEKETKPKALFSILLYS